MSDEETKVEGEGANAPVETPSEGAETVTPEEGNSAEVTA